MVQKLKLVKGSRSVARASTVHIYPPNDSPWEQPGGLSQFGSKKLHFALTEKGVGKSRGWNLFLTRLPGLPNPHPSPC